MLMVGMKISLAGGELEKGGAGGSERAEIHTVCC